jgi:hypothetical protein
MENDLSETIALAPLAAVKSRQIRVALGCNRSLSRGID